jgi:hypothetical protein
MPVNRDGQSLAAPPIVAVLGMHRSGTSMCAHILSVLGLDMVDDIQSVPDAPVGYWERWEIAEFQNRILQMLDRDYFSPQHSQIFPPGWWADPRVRVIRNELLNWLRHRIGDSHRFGFKDPRTCRLLPLWKEVFRELGLEPRYVFCVRDPRQVGRSIALRDRFSYDDSEYRWILYNAHAVAAIAHAPVCVVPYEDWFTDPAPILTRLAAHTGAPMRSGEPEVKRAVADIIDVTLRHDADVAVQLRYITREFYGYLVASATMGKFEEEAIRLAEHLIGFEQLAGPMQAQLTELRDSLEDTKNQLAAARAEVP